MNSNFEKTLELAKSPKTGIHDLHDGLLQVRSMVYKASRLKTDERPGLVIRQSVLPRSERLLSAMLENPNFKKMDTNQRDVLFYETLELMKPETRRKILAKPEMDEYPETMFQLANSAILKQSEKDMVLHLVGRLKSSNPVFLDEIKSSLRKQRDSPYIKDVKALLKEDAHRPYR